MAGGSVASMGFLTFLRGQAPVPVPVKQTSDYFIVAGREHHQSELKRLARRRGWSLPEKVGYRYGLREYVALVPEPDNPHDKRAIMIQAERMCLGYVPRGETARFHREIRAADAAYLTAEAVFWRDPKGRWAVRVLC